MKNSLFDNINNLTESRIERAHSPDLAELLGDTDTDFKLPWDNIPHLFFSRCKKFSSKTAIVFYASENNEREILRLTYNDLKVNVCKTIKLLDTLGVPPGSAIATVDLYNHSDTITILLAAWSRGNLVVPVNMEEDRDRIEFILRSSNVAAAFVRERHLEKFGEINERAGIKTIVQLGGEKKSHPVFHELIEKTVEGEPDFGINISSPALLVYTSGTTGNPKGVILSHKMLYDVDGVVSFHGFSKNDVFLTAMRLFHVNAIITSMMAAIYSGGTLILLGKWMPKYFWKIVSEEKVTTTSVVPAMLVDLNDNNENADERYPQMRAHFKTLICGAGTLKKSVAREFISKYKIRIAHGWGMSETTCWGCWLPRDIDDEEYSHLMFDFEAPSIGTPLRHCKMGILDENGNVLPENQKGEIVIAGRNIMERYAENPDANNETFKFGVLRTGDEGFYKLDRRGRPMFFITGRLKDIIERGGEKFSPYLMDEDLSKIEGVANALVYGFPHKRLGQEVGVVFEMKNEGTIDENTVWKYCRELGYSWSKTPKEIKIVKKIPKTSTGKDTRKMFAKLFEDCYEKSYKRPDWF